MCFILKWFVVLMVVDSLFPRLICSVAQASPNQKPLRAVAGTVSEVKGAPDVLRDPTESLTEEMRSESKRGGYTTVMYQDVYWKAYPITPGFKIVYGDILSSGPDAQMVLTLEDGFRIVLAKQTKVRLTPNFLNSNPDSEVKSWLQVLRGKIRAYLVDHNESPKTEFRTRTIALGVRGTEFVLAVDGDRSKLVTIDGEVRARPVSVEEARLFEQVSEAYVASDTASLEEPQQKLEAITIADAVPIKRGEKVERRELPEKTELEKLDPQRRDELLEQQEQLVVVAVGAEDLQEAQEIGSDIEQLKNDDRQQGLKKLQEETENSVEGSERKTDEEALSRKPWLLSIGLESLGVQHDDFNASAAGLLLNVDYRAWSYAYVGIGLVRGSWELDSMQTPSGKGPADFRFDSDEYANVSLSLGGYYPLTNHIDLGLAFSLIGSRRFALVDPNGKKIRYEIPPTQVIRVTAAYYINENWQIFASFGGGSATAKVTSEEPSHTFNQSDFDIGVEGGFARLGVGWQGLFAP